MTLDRPCSLAFSPLPHSYYPPWELTGQPVSRPETVFPFDLTGALLYSDR